MIDGAVEHGRPLELPPRAGITYRAFVDASGGRHNAYTIAIGHKEGERFVIDVVHGVHPPFDPHEVAREYAALLKQYRISEVTGDYYAAEWVPGVWHASGITYLRSEQNKSAIYLEALPLFARSLVGLPDHARLLRELRLLERHTIVLARTPSIMAATAATIMPTPAVAFCAIWRPVRHRRYGKRNRFWSRVRRCRYRRKPLRSMPCW